MLDSLHPSARVSLRASIKVKEAAVLARRRARTGTPGHLRHARSLVRRAASRDVHVTSCSPRIATTWLLQVQRSIPVHETWPSLGRDEKVKRRVKSKRDGLVWRVRTSGAFFSPSPRVGGDLRKDQELQQVLESYWARRKSPETSRQARRGFPGTAGGGGV